MNIPARIPLTGADYFALVLDHQLRRIGMPGNICRLVMTLDAPIDAVRLKSAMRGTDLLTWLASVRLARRLPPMTLFWRTNGMDSEIPIRDHDDTKDLVESLPIPAHMRPDKVPGLEFDLGVGQNGATTIALTWHHALLDARGAESLLRHISGVAEGNGESGEAAFFANDSLNSRARSGRRLGFPETARFARQSLFLIDEVCSEPIASLMPGGRGLGPRNVFRIIRFTEEETETIDRNCDLAGAGFRKSIFYLAAAIRSFHSVRTRRNAEPEAYVTPVPQDLRKRARPGPVFANWFSFLYYRVEPEDVGCMKKVVASLKAQMTDQIRKGAPQSFASAMEIFRALPLGLCSYTLKRPSRGRVATFIFSDTGHNFRNFDTFLGTPIRQAVHLPPAPYPPGVAVVSGRFRNQLYVVLSHLEGCLDGDEGELFERELRAELAGGSAE